MGYQVWYTQTQSVIRNSTITTYYVKKSLTIVAFYWSIKGRKRLEKTQFMLTNIELRNSPRLHCYSLLTICNHHAPIDWSDWPVQLIYINKNVCLLAFHLSRLWFYLLLLVGPTISEERSRYIYIKTRAYLNVTLFQRNFKSIDEEPWNIMLKVTKKHLDFYLYRF